MLNPDPFLTRRSEACELFIVRHADAIPDADELIPSGIYDDLPLSKVGREQAQALAERFRNTPFNALYSSPLRRCQETAAPLAEQLGMPLALVPTLTEIRLGEVIPLPDDPKDLAALTSALKERQAEIVRRVGQSGSWNSIENSEPALDFRKRVVEGFNGIVRRHIGERVMVFAHGGVINAYVAEALGLEKDFFFPAANTSVTVVRANEQQRVLYVLNDINHLKLF